MFSSTSFYYSSNNNDDDDYSTERCLSKYIKKLLEFNILKLAENCKKMIKRWLDMKFWS